MNQRTVIIILVIAALLVGIFVAEHYSTRPIPSQPGDMTASSTVNGSTDQGSPNPISGSGSQSGSATTGTGTGSSSGSGTLPVTTIPATAAGINAVVKANNQFALDLYSQIIKKAPQNVFFSPYSISTALGMVYEGARGTTATQIQQTLHLSTDDAARKAATAAVISKLNTQNTGYTFSVANAVWADKNYSFLNSYLAVLKQFYGGTATNVDFQHATEAARNIINTWVAQKTNNTIQNLFAQGSLTAQTRMVLTNAVYFKGKWQIPFDPKNTAMANFRTTSSGTVSVPTMRQTGSEARFNYAETADVQVLELPYGTITGTSGDKLSMLLILPKTDTGINPPNFITLAKIADWQSALRQQRVDVYIPKFTLNAKYGLADALSALGMPLAFSNSADFSGMDGTKNLSLQAVVHQAFVDVNEEGTVAAAATGVSIGVTSMPVSLPVFRADHPFVFLIEDITTGNILFMGRVDNPKI